MAEYIVIRPRFDETTEISHAFCNCMTDYLCMTSKSFIDLSQDDAVKAKVEETLKENPTAKVIFFNHGNTEALIGNDKQPVIDKDNVQLLAHREYTITLACEWGADGGVEAWRQGCLAVLCYVDVVSFTTDALPQFEKAFTAAFFLREQSLEWKDILTEVKDLMGTLANELAGEGKFMASACMAYNKDILRIYNGEIPATRCVGRWLAITFLGKRGWKIPSPSQALHWLKKP